MEGIECQAEVFLFYPVGSGEPQKASEPRSDVVGLHLMEIILAGAM